MLLQRLQFQRFFRIFSLFILSCIAFVLVFHLEELTSLVTAGAPAYEVLLFVLLQIPYMLPMAIPVGALLSAALLYMKLSDSEELTALRASGLSLIAILKPMFWLATLLSLCNFLLTSEVATRAHLSSRKLIVKLTSSNPLFLLENDKLMHFKEAFVSLQSVKKAQSAKNLIIAQVHPKHDRLALFLAKSVVLKDNQLHLDHLTLLCPLNRQDLYLENVGQTSGHADEWASLFRGTKWHLAWDHLPFRLLIQKFKLHKRGPADKNRVQLDKGLSEIFRRFSLSLAPFSFTLAGASFAIAAGRQKRLAAFITLIALATAALIALCVAHTLSQQLFLATSLYTLPHCVLISLSFIRLSSLEAGRHVAL